jgi:hypothetical protein
MPDDLELPPEESPPPEAPAPEPAPVVYPFDWMPLPVGAVEIVGWDGFSYVDRAGRTYWSGAEPGEADAIDAVENGAAPAALAPVPESIGPAQIRIALRRIGVTSGQIYALISALPAEAQDDARDLWDYATVIRRDHALIATLAAGLGLSAEQVDDVFRAAATI